MSIIVPGFGENDVVPGAVLQTVYGNGQQSIGSAPLVLACMGGMGATGGTATPDSSVVPVFSYNDIDAAFVAGSEIATMLSAAIDIDGVVAYGVPTAAPTGTPVSATLTVTIGGTWTQGGTVAFRFAGKPVQVNVGPSDTPTIVATSTAASINGVPRLPITATAAVAVATATVTQKGLRGNDYLCAVDLTAAPPGLTVTLAGGTALTGGITPFSGGSGADSVVNALAILSTKTWDLQAWAQRDSTNAALINTALTTQAGPFVSHPGVAVFGNTRTPAAAITLSQTVLNQQLACVVQCTNCESVPHIVAAQVAAIFSVTAGTNPNTRYTDYPCPSLAPQTQNADLPGRSTLQSLLTSGVTVLHTVNGKVQIVDAVCAHSLNGASLDLRTRHMGDVFTPIFIQKDLGALWNLISASNPIAKPDPISGQQPYAEGTIWPARWQSIVQKRLLDHQANNLLEQVEANPAVAAWDSVAKRIMTAVPELVASQNIQLGLVGNQTAF